MLLHTKGISSNITEPVVVKVTRNTDNCDENSFLICENEMPNRIDKSIQGILTNIDCGAIEGVPVVKKIPGFDHLADGGSGEGLASLAGKDMGSPWLLFALQPLQAIGLVAFEVMGAVDGALEAADGDGTLIEIDIIPSEVDELADPQAVQERHQCDHVVAMPVPVTLQCGEQSVELVLGQCLAPAAIRLGPFHFPLYS